MQVVKQLSVFVCNKPGTLAEICDALAEAKINIFGMTVSDTVDHAVIRLVVNDPARAQALFEERGTLVVDNKVILVENDNKPGRVARIARILAKVKVNIEYAYLATSPGAKKGLFVLRPSDVKKAVKALGGRGS
jgi:hypothetical protein